MRFSWMMTAVAAIGALTLGSIGQAQTAPVRYKTIDAPGASTWTAVHGINRRGQFVGFFNDANNKFHGYTAQYGRNIIYTRLDYPGAEQTYALGINNQGVIVGTYFDMSGTQHGFIRMPAASPRRNPRWISLDAPDAVASPDDFELGNGLKTSAFGINDFDDVVGQYADAEGLGHGFVLSAGQWSTIDVPHAFDTPGGDGGTMATHINNWGTIAGAFGGTQSDNSLIRIGFVHSSQRYTPVAPSGSIHTQAYAIGDNGLVGGVFVDSNFVMHGFLWSRGRYSTVDVPGSLGVTTIYDVSGNDYFVGDYLGSDHKSHGYIAVR